jgi:hypothetical protein
MLVFGNFSLKLSLIFLAIIRGVYSHLILINRLWRWHMRSINSAITATKYAIINGSRVPERWSSLKNGAASDFRLLLATTFIYYTPLSLRLRRLGKDFV